VNGSPALKAGAAFLIDPAGGSNDHLWIVLTIYKPDHSYEWYALIANVTSASNRFVDKTCLLRTDDADRHEYVRHESYVYYAEMKEIEVERLAKLGAARAHEPVCDALLARIRDGVHRSPRTPRGHRALVPRG
jgi:hypothetical protein